MSRRAKEQAPLVGGLAQVNLLPPEVRAARGLRVVKRWLGISLGLVVLALGGLFVFSVFSLGVAQTELEAAQADTTRLRNEEAKYAEVPQVLQALKDTTTARALGMSTEVLWKPYIDAMAATQPADVAWETITYAGATPMLAPAAPVSPLNEPALGTLQFSGKAATAPDTAAWIDALNAVPGFSDAWVTTAALETEDGLAFYQVDASVQVLDSARALRFIETAEAEEED